MIKKFRRKRNVWIQGTSSISIQTFFLPLLGKYLPEVYLCVAYAIQVLVLKIIKREKGREFFHVIKYSSAFFPEFVAVKWFCISQYPEASSVCGNNSRFAVFDHYTFGRREAHHAGGVQENTRIGFPAVDLIAAEYPMAFFKVVDKSCNRQVQLHFFYRPAYTVTVAL